MTQNHDVCTPTPICKLENWYYMEYVFRTSDCEFRIDWRGKTNPESHRDRRHVHLERGDDENGPALADFLADPGPTPDEMAERAETRERVWQALGRLPTAQRAAVVLRYYLGLGEVEMAEELGCPPSTVKWRLHAARQRLRQLLRPLRPERKGREGA